MRKAHIKEKKDEEHQKLNESLKEPMIVEDDRTSKADSKEDEDEKLELEDIKTAEKTYAEAYKEFLLGFYHPELDEEIKTYLDALDKYDAGVLRTVSAGTNEDASTYRDLQGKRRESNIEMFQKQA